MRVFVAGSTGAIGVPTVKTLVAAGHEVTGSTRSPSKIAGLERDYPMYREGLKATLATHS